jgi:hypothetical protein
MRLHADTSLAQALLGFDPEIDFERGAMLYINWFRAQHNDPSLLLESEIRNWKMPRA